MQRSQPSNAAFAVVLVFFCGVGALALVLMFSRNVSLKDLLEILDFVLPKSVAAAPAWLVIVLPAAAALRLHPAERGRPWRIGFVLLAPVISAAAIGAALIAGSVVFYLIMFGLFEDKTVMPWFTFLPALALAPPAALLAGFAVAAFGGRLLRYV